MKLFWLATGAAVGYVFGTKAGRERYEQIMAAGREWANKPAVADAVDKVQGLANQGMTRFEKLSATTDAVTAKLSSQSQPDSVPAAVTTRPTAVKATPTPAG